MRKMLVILGLLAVFSLTLTPVYALESSTWGRIKATFSENPVEAVDGLELFSAEAFPHSLAKRVVLPSSTIKFIRAARGGSLVLDNGWAKMSLDIQPGALEGNALVALYIRPDSDGVPWFGVQALPHRTCSPPAKLTIEATMPLAYLPDNLVLVHGIDAGVLPVTYGTEDSALPVASSWEEVPSEIVVTVDKEAGTATLKVTSYLPEFSRYALAASR
jgi:hypothetical protein